MNGNDNTKTNDRQTASSVPQRDKHKRSVSDHVPSKEKDIAAYMIARYEESSIFTGSSSPFRTANEMARAGNADATLYIALCKLCGHRMAKSRKVAVTELEDIARTDGSGLCDYVVGMIYSQGRHVRKNSDKAINAFTSSVQKGFREYSGRELIHEKAVVERRNMLFILFTVVLILAVWIKLGSVCMGALMIDACGYPNTQEFYGSIEYRLHGDTNSPPTSVVELGAFIIINIILPLAIAVWCYCGVKGKWSYTKAFISLFIILSAFVLLFVFAAGLVASILIIVLVVSIVMKVFEAEVPASPTAVLGRAIKSGTPNSIEDDPLRVEDYMIGLMFLQADEDTQRSMLP